MDNISFPKDMTGWSQKETKPVVPPENNAAVAYDKAPDADELNFDLILKHCKVLADVISDELSDLHNMKARKELYDAKIHIALVKLLLKAIK